MVREQIKTDYTEDEIKNLQNSKCWCGKPRSEFAKGLRVYCSIIHRQEWYARTITWSGFRDIFLDKHGKKCKECGATPKSLRKNQQSEYEDWLELIKKNPVVMKIIEEAKIQKLAALEKDYEQIMDINHLIKWEFGYRHSDMPDGLPNVPEEDHWIEDRFEVDHIIAVSLGGDMWDENNLQVLCYKHHKIKTGLDMKKLKAKRRGLKPLVVSEL